MILAIIALIATPIILGVIESARKKAFEDTGYGVIETIRGYYIDKLSEEGVVGENSFTFPSDKLKISGTQPAGGTAKLHADGTIEIAIHNNRWCVTKTVEQDEVTSTDYVEGQCKLIETEHETINAMGTLRNKLDSSTRERIKEIRFIKEDQDVIDVRYSYASTKLDLTYNNEGSVKAWLEGNILFIASDGKTYLTTGEELFYDFSATERIIFDNVDTSRVTNMKRMFYYCYALTSIDLSSFDTSHVTTMEDMFYSCSGFTSLDLSYLNTSSITNMKNMFYRCYKLKSINIGGLGGNNLTDISYMFGTCDGLEEINMSGFNFGKLTNLRRSNTSNILFNNSMGKLVTMNFSNAIMTNITDMSYMFKNLSSLVTIDLSGIDIRHVTNMDQMFYGCSKLTTIYVSNAWNVDHVTSSSNMFYGCNRLVGGIDPYKTTFDSSKTDKTMAFISTSSTP